MNSSGISVSSGGGGGTGCVGTVSNNRCWLEYKIKRNVYYEGSFMKPRKEAGRKISV